MKSVTAPVCQNLHLCFASTSFHSKQTKRMSAQTAPAQASPVASNQRGRRGNRGGKGRGSKTGNQQQRPAPSSVLEPTVGIVVPDPASAEVAEEDSELEVCFICAEPVKYWAVGQCNHRTCHVCALRLRALYKKPDCTFCKVGY